MHELEGQLEQIKKDKQKYELAAEENERKFRSANAKLQEAAAVADRAGGGAKESKEEIEKLKDEVAQLKRTLAELRGVKAANAKLFELMEARRFKNEAALQAVEVIRDGE